MNSVTEPVILQSRHPENARSAKDWLDALAAGACDQDAFLRGLRDNLQRAPDSGWDVLALVDQYYRRGKLTADTFGTLKAHLQNLLIGKGQNHFSSPAAVNVAAPAPRPASAHAGSTPASRPAPARAASARGSALEAPEPAAAGASASGALEDAARHRPLRSLAVGDVLRGRYLVKELIGQGGMGTVFAATDQFRLDRSQGDQQVAIKVLHTEVIKRPRLFAELRREFQHLQALTHPNIVRVHEFDRDGDLAFFTMEYLSGGMLSRVLAAQESSGLYRPFALAIIRDVGAAVAHAHARGVVHGDLNPGNIFITDHGEVRVLDFGASHQLHRGPWISEFDSQRNVAVATPLYASCQLLEGEAADARDDVYALACIAYILLAGDHPFGDATALKARTARLSPARPRGLRRRQWHALLTGLQFDRERRPTDIQAWLTALDLTAAAPRLPELPSLTTMRRPSPRGSHTWIRYAAAAVVLALGAWWSTLHVDSIAGVGTAVSTEIKSLWASPTVSQWWDKTHRLGGKTEPVIPGPVTDSTMAETPAGVPIPMKPSSDLRRDTAPTEVPAPRAMRPVVRAAPTVAASAAAPVPAASNAPPISAAPVAAAAGATAAGAAAAGSITAGVAAGAPAGSQAAQNGAGSRAHVELAADNVDVPASETSAHVIVRRSRSYRGDVSFTWWTESGTAKPGRDFTPVEAHVVQIGNGRTAGDLVIPVVADPSRQAPKSFYVVIDQPSDNAVLGPRTLTMITLNEAD